MPHNALVRSDRSFARSSTSFIAHSEILARTYTPTRTHEGSSALRCICYAHADAPVQTYVGPQHHTGHAPSVTRTYSTLRHSYVYAVSRYASSTPCTDSYVARTVSKSLVMHRYVTRHTPSVVSRTPHTACPSSCDVFTSRGRGRNRVLLDHVAM